MKREIIDRDSWNAMLERIDGEIAAELLDDLHTYAGGDTCQAVSVVLDSMGRLDSQSAPRPADDEAYTGRPRRKNA